MFRCVIDTCILVYNVHNEYVYTYVQMYMYTYMYVYMYYTVYAQSTA